MQGFTYKDVCCVQVLDLGQPVPSPCLRRPDDWDNVVCYELFRFVNRCNTSHRSQSSISHRNLFTSHPHHRTKRGGYDGPNGRILYYKCYFSSPRKKNSVCGYTGQYTHTQYVLTRVCICVSFRTC